MPGQYLRVGVDVDGVRLWRTYSLTHGPRPDGCISITVKGIPDGVVSNHLVHRVRPGQMIHLGQAEGEFVLPDADARQAAAGHRRLRHHAGDRDAAQPVLAPSRRADIVLLHSAPPRRSIFGDELRRYAAEGRLRLVEMHTDAHGMLDVADLEEIVPDLHERITSPAARSGCSTPSRRTTPSATCR